MVILRFENPSYWSLGQKTGALAAVFLFLGPFLPFWGREYLSGEVDSVIYADPSTFGLLFLLPFVSALLIMLLLFFNFNIYIEDEMEHKKINHYILFTWGAIFFLIYIADVIRVVRYSTSYYSQYAGIGLWFIVFGYTLCTIAGYLEWKRPQMVGPQIFIKNEKVPVVVSSNGGYPISPEKNGLTNTPEPIEDYQNILKQWSEHVSDNGKTFEQCIKCNRYTFFTTEETEDSIIFNCGNCKTSFALSK